MDSNRRSAAVKKTKLILCRSRHISYCDSSTLLLKAHPPPELPPSGPPLTGAPTGPRRDGGRCGAGSAGPFVQAALIGWFRRRNMEELHGLTDQVERAGDGDEAVLNRCRQCLAQRGALDDPCPRIGVPASHRKLLRCGAALARDRHQQIGRAHV